MAVRSSIVTTRRGLAVVVVAAVSAAALVGPAVGPGAAATAPVRVDTAVVPMPDHVTEVQLPWWTRDGKAIVLSARSTQFPGTQIVRIAPDGSDFACLTCAIAPGDPPLMKPIPFADGRRLVVRVGNQTPVSTSPHAVLECTPSLLDCTQAELVPVEVPVDDGVVQDQREFRVAPAGDRVGFTQMRKNARGEAVYVATVAGLERLPDRYRLVDPRAVSALGELKDFTADGRGVVVSSFVEGPEAANSDDLVVDLASGDVTRLTTYPDYEEPAEQSPDGRRWAIGSARTAELFEPLAQVRRPNFIGTAISPLAFYIFNRYRDELLEPWLVTAAGERSGELGTLLNPGSVDAGWEGRMIPNWNRDGRRILFWEARTESTAGSADAGSRVVVATLGGVRPGTPLKVRAPDPDWAPPLAGYRPAAALPESRTGTRAGRVDVTVDETNGTSITVRYAGFSDEPGWVLDGTETITNIGGPTGTMTYSADITLSGRHEGFLRATDVAGGVSGFRGVIESEVDGKALRLDLGA